MDNTKEFTAVEFCAGYGGIHLGIARVIPNLRVIAFSEIEAFACANLVAKMEAGLLAPAPIWTNLKTFPCEQFCDRVDLLVAGYPCQPFSHAGKRSGAEDPRHLWPGVKRAIRLFRPRSCFFENVEGHLTLGFKDVCHDLDELGYRVTAGLFTASEVGAPHKRKRLFILAKLADSKTNGCSHGQSQKQSAKAGLNAQRNPSRSSKKGLAHSEQSGLEGRESITRNNATECQAIKRSCSVRHQCPGEELANTEEAMCEQSRGTRPGRKRFTNCCWPSRPGEPQYGWEPPRVVGNTSRDNRRARERRAKTGTWEEGKRWRGLTGAGGRKIKSEVGRGIDGPPGRMDYAELQVSCDNRTDELRLLGNGVVPAVAAKAWQVLYSELEEKA